MAGRKKSSYFITEANKDFSDIQTVTLLNYVNAF